VRYDGWKYVHHLSDVSFADELYDLARDPDENNNLAPDRQDKVTELQTLLQQHLNKPQRRAVLHSSELSTEELETMREHLEKMGYMQ
jgi:arylsulfatase A-like enzyme